LSAISIEVQGVMARDLAESGLGSSVKHAHHECVCRRGQPAGPCRLR
jgi:hypothetical protein